MLSTSIKPVTELYVNPPQIIPDHPTVGNYISVLKTPTMYVAFLNSVVVTASVVVLTLFFSILAGYGLARHRFKGSNLVKLMVLMGQMVPAVVLVIPMYFMFAKFKILDTKFALIIADLALTLPMGIVMLSAFFLTVPKELEEAACIDGCNEYSALFRIILPIAKPGIVSVTIYTFIHAWEEFLFALNLTNSSTHRTLPIAISMFSGEFNVDWGATMAAASIVALPVLAIFLLCNKYFVKGLNDGAVKG
jgi:ABC-type glycerol-3-phosphate transport system permease component